jgi:hypothetical protein
MATKANILIDQGSDFTTEILLTDTNGNPLTLTNFEANAQIRHWYTSSNAVNFNVNLSSGTITLNLDANTTSSLTRERYVYDVILHDVAGNTITRVVEGIVTVSPRVTR